MAAPKEILRLQERFTQQREAYQSGQYNEAQIRAEFIDPFFKALGWDVHNEQGHAEAYKDVVHEDALKIGGATEAPDLCFRIGGARKFFVECKKPSVNIKDAPHPAYQLRRYAWSAKLPLSILTDFEELAVYDCRIKPSKNDSAAIGRLLYFTCEQYAEKWDNIAAIFSHEAILKGSFDKYAESTKGKRGTASVDDAILEEIERWRDLLAHNIALRNPKLSQRELNFAVQRTIDRIIFLRICEDRGIEDYGRLLALAGGQRIYPRLCQLFEAADTRYNSGIFHFAPEKDRHEPPDELTLHLNIDDKPLQNILHGLYYPDSPYEFSVLSADILGQVYEQFLGKVIRLTEGHRAVVDDKPEVKKAGGVYYTPTYIVDYIVKNTVGKLLEDKTPKKAAKLRVLDPACGSGSFLIGAYQRLLDWHWDWYMNHDPAKWAKGSKSALVQTRGGSYRLTIDERKRILLNNIYGVDIDSQAVEVTKLSLLLKVLEGETGQSLEPLFKIFHERALPDLGNNIKCGNSLIGPDFYQQSELPLLTDDEKYRINAFDWQAEFREIFRAGGFDGVIGNPPWGADFSMHEQAYLRRAYSTARASNIDSYAVFVETAFMRLKMNGLLSYIIPDTFLRKDNYLPTRQLFLQNTKVLELIETGPVFSKVRDTWCLVFTVVNAKSDKRALIRHRKLSRFIVSAEERLEKFGTGNWDEESEVPQSLWLRRPNLVVGYKASVAAQELTAKVEQCSRLGLLPNRFRISRGEEGSKFALKAQPQGDFFMVIPDDVQRYGVSRGICISSDHLTPGKIATIYSHPKLWIIRIQKMRWRQRIVCGLDRRSNSAGMKTLQSIVSPSDDENDLKYLQGIISSSLVNFWCINYLADDMNQSYLEKLPIRTIDFSNPADKSRHDRMVKLVEQMQELHEKFPAAKTPQEKTTFERQITATDQEIDRLVYELYGLTEEEIKIVNVERASGRVKMEVFDSDAG